MIGLVRQETLRAGAVRFHRRRRKYWGPVRTELFCKTVECARGRHEDRSKMVMMMIVVVVLVVVVVVVVVISMRVHV